MSTLLMDGHNCAVNNVLSHHHSHVLKSRENTFKPKCNKALKKKLKKYKLRRDGQEDPAIIDVSQTLIASLRIKSPNSQHIPDCDKTSKTEENRSYNYLTKMVRLKKNAIELISTNDEKNNSDIVNENISLTPIEDQDKKQMDAFKLLMNSRNKSIGTNSPGKERGEEEIDIQEITLKKELKAKRILSLNKMAEAKGFLKKVEIEEHREHEVKRKMNNRAKRLKNMISDVDTKNANKCKFNTSHDKLVKDTVNHTALKVNGNIDSLNIKAPILKPYDLFKDLKVSENQTDMKEMSREDEEFLRKLAPSIKKKENMLCYFQKVSKDSQSVEEDFESESHDNNHAIIKVKTKSKCKVKKRNKSHVSNKKKNISENYGQNVDPDIHFDGSHKRKRNLQRISKKEITNNDIDGSVQCNADNRPKRMTKRPVKYTDNFLLSSSDEELHIFTPKKKRKEKYDSQSTLKAINDTKGITLDQTETKKKPLESKQAKIREGKKRLHKNEGSHKIKAITQPILQTKQPKKATKLAPIFKTKPQIDAAALEAKQKFLHSGVPNQLKKTSNQQATITSTGTDEFHSVVHVQNLSNVNTAESTCNIDYIDKNYDEDMIKCISIENYLFEKLLDHTKLGDCSMPKLQSNVDLILKDLKLSYPKFPVYRTYHLLKGKSKGEFKDCVYPDLDNSIEILSNLVDVNIVNPDQLNWSNKYKPATEKQVIGNFESIKELKRWLVTWTENDIKKKRNTRNESDSSDFYESDTDSREAMRNFNNLLIITGKVGSGKTISVYAVAAELAIKVIEVNASTKRTGKIMLQDLQEATQSHKVNRGKSSTDCSQKSQDTVTCDNKLNIMKKRGRKKKIKDSDNKIVTTKKESTEVIVSQDNNRTGMSLILIDDADIVFDQDDGFCSAISQLIQSSKRPVILVTSSLTCPHLQKFFHMAKIIKMRPFIPRMLGTWLDIMCLVDINMCSPGLGAKTLDLFKGDIRKAINYLQFYMTSHKYLCNVDSSYISQGEVDSKVNGDDENSCTSWKENEEWADKNTCTTNFHEVTSKYFIKKQLQLLQPLNIIDNFNVWWNLPDLLDYSSKCRVANVTDNICENDNAKNVMKLNVIAGLLNTMSIIDYLEMSNLNNEMNSISRPWHSCESPSIIDSENLSSYNENKEYMKNIAYELMTKGISEAQRVLECTNKTEIEHAMLSMSIHRERERVVSRHNTLTSYLNPSAALDRRALALDYWPMCRNICRTEKSKTDNKSKRNNRFCHYLKSLNVLCKNDYFDNLCDSLSSSYL